MNQADMIEVDRENDCIIVHLPAFIEPTNKITFYCSKDEIHHFQIGDLNIDCSASADYVYYVEVTKGEEEIINVGDIELRPDDDDD